MHLRVLRPEKTKFIVSAIAVVALAVMIWVSYRSVTRTQGLPSRRILLFLGEKNSDKYGDLKDYDPANADPSEKAMIAAASACVVETHLLSAEGIEGNAKILRYDANRDVRTVIFFHESGPEEEDRHTSALFVQVARNSKPTYTGVITGGPIDAPRWKVPW